MRQKEREAIAGIMAAYGERLRAVEAQQRQMANLLAQQGQAMREIMGHVTEGY